ncbi:Nn.00g027490.m01.CDS01 [Neocucurbitaria sp. VM-36]
MTPSTVDNRQRRPTGVRGLPLKQRQALIKGPVVQFRKADGTILEETMALTLFHAATSDKSLVVATNEVHAVQLPDHADPGAFKFFIKHMNNLSSEEYVGEVPFTKHMALNLHLCSVAEDLGMAAYTQYIFNGYYHRLKTEVPMPSDVEAIGQVNTPLGNKLFKTVGYRLAVLAWDDEHPNITAFNKYLAKNDRLAAIVDDSYAKRRAAAQRQAGVEERRLQEEEAARLAKEREEHEIATAKERSAKDKKKWAAQKQKDADVRARVMEKKRAGLELTREEAAMHYEMYGKHVPV